MFNIVMFVMSENILQSTVLDLKIVPKPVFVCVTFHTQFPVTNIATCLKTFVF